MFPHRVLDGAEKQGLCNISKFLFQQLGRQKSRDGDGMDSEPVAPPPRYYIISKKV